VNFHADIILGYCAKPLAAKQQMTGTLVQQWTMVDYTSNVGGKKNFWNVSSKNFTVSALGVSAGTSGVHVTSYGEGEDFAMGWCLKI